MPRPPKIDLGLLGAVGDADGSGGGTDILPLIVEATSRLTEGVFDGSYEGSRAGTLIIPPGDHRVAGDLHWDLSGVLEGVGGGGGSSGRAASRLIFDKWYGFSTEGSLSYTRHGAVTPVLPASQPGGLAAGSIIRNLDILSAHYFESALQPRFSPGATYAVGDDCMPNTFNKYSYTLRVVAITTGVAGSALIPAPTTRAPAETRIVTVTNTTPIVVTTEKHHFKTTGDQITISEVLGTTSANGTWTITVTGSKTFELNSSAGNGAYTSGGWARIPDIVSGGVTFRVAEVRGVAIRAITHLENMRIVGFPTGIYMNAQVDESDISTSTARNVTVVGGGDGLVVWGNDANTCLFDNVQIRFCGGVGNFDEALAPNHYSKLGIHYCRNHALISNVSIYEDIYIEGGQPPPVLTGTSQLIGGSTLGVTPNETGGQTSAISGQFFGPRPSAWQASTQHFVGSVVAEDGRYFRVQRGAGGATAVGAPGNSGVSAPAWSTLGDPTSQGEAVFNADNFIVDNELEWVCYSRGVISRPRGPEFSQSVDRRTGPVYTSFRPAGLGQGDEPFLWSGELTGADADANWGLRWLASQNALAWVRNDQEGTAGLAIAGGAHPTRDPGQLLAIRGVVLGDQSNHTARLGAGSTLPSSGNWIVDDLYWLTGQTAGNPVLFRVQSIAPIVWQAILSLPV